MQGQALSLADSSTSCSDGSIDSMAGGTGAGAVSSATQGAAAKGGSSGSRSAAKNPTTKGTAASSSNSMASSSCAGGSQHRESIQTGVSTAIGRMKLSEAGPDPIQAWEYACSQHSVLPASHQQLLQMMGSSSRTGLWTAACLAGEFGKAAAAGRAASNTNSDTDSGLGEVLLTAGVMRTLRLYHALVSARDKAISRSLQQSSGGASSSSSSNGMQADALRKQQSLHLLMAPLLLHWAAQSPAPKASSVMAACTQVLIMTICMIMSGPGQWQPSFQVDVPGNLQLAMFRDTLPALARVGAQLIQQLDVRSVSSNPSSDPQANHSSSSSSSSSQFAGATSPESTGSNSSTAANVRDRAVTCLRHLVSVVTILGQSNERCPATACQQSLLPPAEESGTGASGGEGSSAAAAGTTGGRGRSGNSGSGSDDSGSGSGDSGSGSSSASTAVTELWGQHAVAVVEMYEAAVRAGDRTLVTSFYLRPFFGGFKGKDTSIKSSPLSSATLTSPPGSILHQQVYSAQCSVRKALSALQQLPAAAVNHISGSEAVDTCEQTIMFVGFAMTGAQGTALADAARAAAAGTDAAAMLPWLVLLGCCCLFAVTHMQQFTSNMQAAAAAGAPATSNAAAAGASSASAEQLLKLMDSVVYSLSACEWLQQESAKYANKTNQEELAASGYLVADLPAKTCAAAWALHDIVAGGIHVFTGATAATATSQLLALGHALNSLPVPCCCNNPSCSNLEGPLELQLVDRRTAICSACMKARYCSKACQRQHWKQHKPACKALAAAAAQLEAESETTAQQAAEVPLPVVEVVAATAPSELGIVAATATDANTVAASSTNDNVAAAAAAAPAQDEEAKAQAIADLFGTRAEADSALGDESVLQLLRTVPTTRPSISSRRQFSAAESILHLLQLEQQLEQQATGLSTGGSLEYNTVEAILPPLCASLQANLRQQGPQLVSVCKTAWLSLYASCCCWSSSSSSRCSTQGCPRLAVLCNTTLRRLYCSCCKGHSSYSYSSQQLGP